MKVYHGVRKVYHGVRNVYHGVRKVYHGVRKVYHGVRKVCHGVRKVYHGVRKVYHGQSSIIIHWIGCLPLEQGCISMTSLISNYDHGIWRLYPINIFRTAGSSV
jgi:hypothetical protein